MNDEMNVLTLDIEPGYGRFSTAAKDGKFYLVIGRSDRKVRISTNIEPEEIEGENVEPVLAICFDSLEQINSWKHALETSKDRMEASIKGEDVQ